MCQRFCHLSRGQNENQEFSKPQYLQNVPIAHGPEDQRQAS